MIHNLVEQHVVTAYDQLKGHFPGFCGCEVCRSDVLVYALNRHHPDPRVGRYTQQAAYRFYGVTGFFVVVATFIPGSGWIWHLAAWIVAALILIPWSILDLHRIRREMWIDIQLDDAGHPVPGSGLPQGA